MVKSFNKKKFKVYKQNRSNIHQLKNLGQKLKSKKWSFLRYDNSFSFFSKSRVNKMRFFYGNILKLRRALKHQNCVLTTDNLKKIYLKAKNGNSKHLKILNILESRLDVALFRSGFCSSPLQLRQFIFHKNVYVNGIVINKPGYLLKKNDLVQLNFAKLGSDIGKPFKNPINLVSQHAHLEVNSQFFCFIYLGFFKENEVPYLNKENISFLNYVFKR
jgi:ribosomal protein S4